MKKARSHSDSLAPADSPPRAVPQADLPPENGLVVFLLSAVIGAVIGLIYSWSIGGQFVVGIGIGTSIGASIAAFEVLFVHHPRGRWFRRLPLSIVLVVAFIVWTASMTFSLHLIPYLLSDDPGNRYADGPFGEAFRSDLVFSLLVALVVTTAMRLRSLVGGRVLVNFLSGRYRLPVDEQRVFLFLDLCQSTRISELLGSVKYHAFLRDFVEALESPIAHHGGEVYQYIGDAVVATWPMKSPAFNTRALNCYFAMNAAIARRASYFERSYNIVPTFRVGIHCGDVVAGEIGEHRRQIVFAGDAVNTAARVVDQARELNRSLLITDATLQNMVLSDAMVVRPVGRTRLKGVAESVELFEVFVGAG